MPDSFSPREPVPHDRIVHAEALTSIFGYWPSFHDAEVLRVRLDRADPSLEADIHVFEITSDVTPKGYLALRHHTLVTFRFERVSNLKAAGFGTQNALFGVRLKHNPLPPFPDFEWEVAFRRGCRYQL